LKAEYVDGMSILEARKLALKVMKQTIDSTVLMPEKVEMCEVALVGNKEIQQVGYRVVCDGELQALCDEANLLATPII
jgi:20S proteasome subunit alpha 3|tara:strand:- start:3884 stop:4117 length:234 start_codon:yes stop_codon:yes gene_type:complete